MERIIKKNINQEKTFFLIFFNDKEIEIFTFSDIEKNRRSIHPYSDILSSRFITAILALNFPL